MPYNATCPVQKQQGLNREKLLRFGAVVTLVCSLLFSAACSILGNSSTNSTKPPQSLAISGTLPAAVKGVKYNAPLTVTGGTAPYQFAIATGQLPTGLTLGATTGTISGMPSNTGSYSFTVAATDSGSNSASHSFQVTVSNTGSVAVAVTPLTATVASGATQQFTALVSNTSNVAVTWTASLGTISNSGLYQAPPTVSANTTATVTATSVADPSKSGTSTVTVTPSAPPPPLSITTTSLSGATTGSTYSNALSATGGKSPYSWMLTSGTLPSGITVQSAGSISGTTSQAGQFNFTVQAADSSSPRQTATKSFTLTVSAVTVTVSVIPATATVTSGVTKQFTALVSNTSNVAVTWSASPGTISNSGLYQAPTVTSTTTAIVTATSVAAPTASGKATVTVTASAPPPMLSIATTSLSGATAGSAYSNALSATGGTSPYSWTLVSGTLPAGIAVQSAGSISGTTTQTGQFTITAQASDSSSPKQTATRSLTLTVSSAKGGGPLPPATFFGFTDTSTQSKNFPTVSYGMQRFWDSPPLQWPSINTASGVFDFTNLDSNLSLGYSSGVMYGMYTLARTPPWASSNPSDSSCHYTTAASGGGLGECDAPIDLNSDGSGSNAIWKAWITAIATHVNNATYLQTHSHIKYWEIWNEPDNQPFWSGSFAQLARLTEDANCIITGRGVIHENGNGTATPCTATAIDPTAQIVMSSGHAKGAALTYAQNQLYCNASPTGYQLPCPIPSNAIAAAVDIINFHLKPGNETGNNCPAPTPCTPESAMQMYLNSIHGLLQPAELAKPLWDGEASYAMNGFTNAYTDPDMAASFMPRFYLINWSLNISGMAWYDWNELVAQPASVQTAYQQTYNWLANSSLSTPCTASGTVWSCGITQSGKQYQIMWDTAQSCSSGSCTLGNQTVGSQWTQYQDMTAASSKVTISGHIVPVGIKPVVLQ